MIARFLGCGAALLFAIAFQATAAHAQATGTWVSGVGDDVNPCSRTAPCKTFAGALSKTAPNGEIRVLDPGGYGAVTIAKPITIVADGDLGTILAALTNGVIISPSFTPAGGRVILRGIKINGNGNGLNGVRVLGNAKVLIEDVAIEKFTQNGVDVQGPAGTRVFLNRVTVTQTNNGVFVSGASAAANTVFIDDSLFDNNTVAAVNVGATSTVVLNDSTLSGSGGTDLTITAGGQAISSGNNLIRTGTPTSTSPLK